MCGGARGAPLGWAKHHTAETNRGTHNATAALVTGRDPLLPTKQGHLFKLQTPGTRAALFVFGRLKSKGDDVSSSLWTHPMGKAHRNWWWWLWAGGRGITPVNHVGGDQSVLSPQLAVLFQATRRHSSGHKLLRNEVRQCCPLRK